MEGVSTLWIKTSIIWQIRTIDREVRSLFYLTNGIHDPCIHVACHRGLRLAPLSPTANPEPRSEKGDKSSTSWPPRNASHFTSACLALIGGKEDAWTFETDVSLAGCVCHAFSMSVALHITVQCSCQHSPRSAVVYGRRQDNAHGQLLWFFFRWCQDRRRQSSIDVTWIRADDRFRELEWHKSIRKIETFGFVKFWLRVASHSSRFPAP